MQEVWALRPLQPRTDTGETYKDRLPHKVHPQISAPTSFASQWSLGGPEVGMRSQSPWATERGGKYELPFP